jgi:uncharacterized protein (TIGR02145 family)
VKKFPFIFAVAFLAFYLISCAPEADDVNPFTATRIGSGSFIDSRDGQSYGTVTIGSQTWMAKNLNYNASGSKCYNNQDSYCDTYGRLYDWAMAMALPSSCETTSCASQVNTKHRGICPKGWHIPSNAEWDVLVNSVGGSSTAGKYLKAKSGWDDSSEGNSFPGLDTYGFTALPGGYYHDYSGTFSGVGIVGYWWSTNERISVVNYAYYIAMGFGHDAALQDNGDKISIFYVRCVQD